VVTGLQEPREIHAPEDEDDLDQRTLERLNEVQAPDPEEALNARTLARVNAPPPHPLTRAAIGAAESLATLAQAPELAFKALGGLVPLETLQQQIPNLLAGSKALADAGRDIQAYTEELDPAVTRPQTLTGQLPYALGSLVPTIAGSALGGAGFASLGLKAAIGQAVGVAATGAAQSSVSLYHDVLAATVDDQHPEGNEEAAMTAAALGLGIGASEIVGASGILLKLNRAMGGGLMRYMGAVATGALEEGAQNAFQQAATDAAMEVLTPEEFTVLERLERTGKAGALGLVVGGLVSSAAHAPGALLGGRSPDAGRTQEEGRQAAGGPAEGAARRTAEGFDRPRPKPKQAGKTVEEITLEARGQGAAPGAQLIAPEPVSGESGGQVQPETHVVAESQPSAAQSATAGTPPTYAFTEEPASNSSVQPGDQLGPVQVLPIGALREFNPKKRTEQGKVAEIEAEMRAGKTLPPVIASRGEDGGLVIDDGSHRIEAAKRLGFEAVPVRIVEGKETKATRAPAAELEEPRIRMKDAVEATRTLVTLAEDPNSDDIDYFQALDQAESILRQRGAAGVEATEVDAALEELVRAAKLRSDLEDDTPKAKAQTGYTQAAIKHARAVLDLFDAAKRAATPARRAGEQAPAGAEEPASRGVPAAVPEAAPAGAPSKVERVIGGWLDRSAREAAAEGLAEDLVEQEQEGAITLPQFLEPILAPGGLVASLTDKGRAALEKAAERASGLKVGDFKYSRNGVGEDPITDTADLIRFATGDQTFEGMLADDRRLFGFVMELAEGQRQHQAGTNPFTTKQEQLEQPAKQLPAAPTRPLPPAEEASDRILRGERLTLEEIKATPGAIKRASERAQRGEKPRPKPEALRSAAAKVREGATEELERERLENTPKRAREGAAQRRRARQQIEVADVMERLAAAQEAGEAGVLEGVNSRAQVEDLLRLARITEGYEDSEGHPVKPRELGRWGAFVRAGQIGVLLEKVQDRKGVPALRQRLGGLIAMGRDFQYVDAPERLEALRELAKMAEGYDAKQLLESIRDFERLRKVAGSRDELQAAVDAVRALRDQAPGLTEEQKTTERIKAAEAAIRFQKIPGFFPTPPALVERMVAEAGIEEGMRVLEPSAGKGDLADAAKDAGGQVDVVEPQMSLRGILQAKGYSPVGNDFTEFQSGPVYDRVLMNPPFENGQDIAHVRRAYDMLAPGGRLVALMSEGTFGRSGRAAEEFRAWLEERGGTSEKVEAGAFQGAGVFRETGVATRLVVVDKPEAAAAPAEFEALARPGQPIQPPALREGAAPATPVAPTVAAEPPLGAAEAGGGSPVRRRLFELSERRRDEHRQLLPRHGEVSVGAMGFDPFLEAEVIDEVLRLTASGDSPALASVEAKAKAYAREVVQKHNAQRPADINWKRALTAGDDIVDRTLRALLAASPAPAAAVAPPPTVAPGGVANPTHRQMQELRHAEAARRKALAALDAIEQTRPWSAYMQEKRTTRKGRWDGNFLRDTGDDPLKSPFFTDGRSIILRKEIQGPVGMDGLPAKAKPLTEPHPSHRHVPEKALAGVFKDAQVGVEPATLDGVLEAHEAPAGERWAPRVVAHTASGRVGMADALRLRFLMDLTGADGVSIPAESGKKPWLLTRKGKPVAALMPLTGDATTEALAVLPLPPAERAAELARRRQAIGGEGDIREVHAFPGGMLDPLVRAGQRLVDRLRRTPALQQGAAPLPTAKWTEKAVQRHADYFEPVQRIERALAGERRPGEANLPDAEDAYLQETLRRGRTLNGPRGLKWLEETFQEPLLKLMRRARISLDEADEFLMARNARDGNALIRARNPENPELTRYGMTDEEADAILARIKADPRAALFHELGERHDALHEATLARHVESGRMTQEAADALKAAQPHYTPARTDMSGPDGEPIQVPSGKKRVGKPFQKALGRESRADSPLAFSFAQAEQAIVQGEINRTRQAFLSMVRAYADEVGDAIKVVQVPMQRVLGANGEVRESFDPFWRGRNDVVVAWENGKPVGMQIAPEHADLARALQQLGPTQAEGITKLAQAFNRIRSGLITRYRPFFWPFNLVRDVGSAAYLGSEFGVRFSGRVVADVPRAMATLAGKQTALSPMLERYRAAGGPISFLDLSSLETQLNSMQKALDTQETGPGDKAVSGFLRLKEAMNTASDIGENATRFSAFVHAVEDLGWSDERAAAYAKELQNFERRGLAGSHVSAWYMFANAGVQSGRRFAQAMRNPAVRRTIAASFVAAMGWDALQRALGGEAPDGEDWWDKIPDWEKQGNFIFMYPDGSGRRVNIPAPFVFGAVNYTGQQLGALLTGNIGAGKFLASSTEAWVNALNPLGGMGGDDGQGLLRALTPDIARLPLEIATNRDWKGAPIGPPSGGQKPDSASGWPDTSPTAKAVAAWVNSATGGDQYEPGAIDIGPETLEHVAEFFGSGVPQDIVAVGQTLMKKLGGAPIPGREIPLLKRILREPSPFASWREQEDLLYSLKAEAKRAKDEKRLLSKEARGVIEIGDAVRRDREKAQENGKLDALPERQKQQELQRLDLAAQQWSKRAREVLKKATAPPR